MTMSGDDYSGDQDALMSRRTYVVLKAMLAGAPISTAIETVENTALEHPEWDMEERRTWAEWEQD